MEEQLKEAVELYKTKLEDEFNILIDGMTNTEVILTHLFKPDSHQSYYNYVTYAIRKEGIGYHDLQKFLISRVQEYFTEFDEDVTVDTKYQNTYPTTLRATYQGHPFISFSFYYHTFSDERPSRTLEYGKKENARDRKEIKVLEEKISRYEDYLEKPLRMLRVSNYKTRSWKTYRFLIRDIFLFVKVGQKKLRENIKESISDLRNMVERIEKQMQGREERVKKIEEILPSLNEKYEKWEKKMIDLGYKNHDGRGLLHISIK